MSDLNFKPCPCGYQVSGIINCHGTCILTWQKICRFCWHHIKVNLNRRCPACRREYSDEAVQFKAINKEEYAILSCSVGSLLTVLSSSHKRLTQMKRQRDKERKELDALGRRHMLNVRVVQRNVVYVVGLGSHFAKEEVCCVVDAGVSATNHVL